MSLIRSAAVAVAMAAWCLLGWNAGYAQQAPAKPGKPTRPATSAAPAPAGPIRGFGTARGPMLKREELRVCLAQDEALKKRLEAQDASRASLEQEKKEISDEQAAMRTERAKVEGGELPGAIAAFTARNNAFGERRGRWEAQVKVFNEAGSNATEEQRNALSAERAELEKERAALEAERVRLQAAQDQRLPAAQAFNVRLRAFDTRVEDWNKRSRAWTDTNHAFEADRAEWMNNCGNRRYREEDEIAIRSGK